MDFETEAAWVEGLRKGDSLSYKNIVESTIGRLLSVARRYLEEDEARDAVQETYITLLGSIDKFRGDSRLMTWLQRVLINHCLGKLRKQKSRREVSIEDLLPEFYEDGHRVDPQPAWPNLLSDSERREKHCTLVMENINKLPLDHRKVILLRDIEGYSGQKTADALEISVGAVKVRLHRARQALRQLLEPVVLEQANDL